MTLAWLPGPSTPLAQAAHIYADHKMAVFPVGADKRPLVEGGFKAATTDENVIKSWWQRWPSASIGWHVAEGVVVVDVDARHRGHESLDELERTHGKLPATMTAITGGGGLHLYFKAPGVQVRQLAGLRPGIDTRTARGYVILPPSKHTSGLRYAWRDRLPPVQTPAWLLDLVRVRPVVPPELVAPLAASMATQSARRGAGRTCPECRRARGRCDACRAQSYAELVLKLEASDVAQTPEGRRNHRLTAAWFRCTRDHEVAQFLDRQTVRDTLAQAARVAGLGDGEINRTLRDEVRAA